MCVWSGRGTNAHGDECTHGRVFSHHTHGTPCTPHTKHIPRSRPPKPHHRHHAHTTLLGWARRDWLRGGVCNCAPLSVFVQLLKINNQNRHEMGHRNSACAQQFQRTQKTHSSDAAIRKQCAFDTEVQPLAKFMRVGSRLAKSRFKKHLHACIVVQSLT